MDIRQAITRTMQVTGDPTAPFKIQELYARTADVGKMLTTVPGADKAKAIEFSDKLLSAFPEDMNEVAEDPNFTIALCNLLHSALLAWVIEVVHKEDRQ